MTPKKPHDVGGRVDDYIRSTGNVSFVNLFLKFSLAIMGLVCLAMAGSLYLMSQKIGEVKTIPIFINGATGEAKASRWEDVDASGEIRKDVEVKYFAREILRNLFTYTQNTAASNMEEALRFCTTAAAKQIKAQIDMEARANSVAAMEQGTVQIESINIISTSPSLQVQAIYTTRILRQSTDDTRRMIATFRIKTIPRSEANPHGLAVVEYSQSHFEQQGV